jgi:two-component system, NarL family, sensor histidine kinase DesK
LCIVDNGKGGIALDGNGLSGMRERIAALGGTLGIDSPRGQGTRVLVRVPMKPGQIQADPIAVPHDEPASAKPSPRLRAV